MGYFTGPKLLDFKSSPPHLQFNKYVHTGYRPISTCRECLRSLFYLHNEFGNIYTHGVPFICFLLFLPVSIPWAEVDEWWIGIVHYLACLSPTICSVFYHLFMNHEGGAPIYDTLLCFDMFGVCLVNTLGALPIIHITLLCHPITRQVAMLAYLLLSGYGVHCALTAESNIHRLQSFIWQAGFRFVLFMFRLIGPGRGSPSSLQLYLTMDALAMFGGLVNVSRFPERFSPGRFDYWLNSHQIMHIMVVLSILYLHWGMLEDLRWLKGYHCPDEYGIYDI
ncbi:progestin and adipoQ receptor family member 4 [Danio rerio]|uniref:Progestin and adipoQ receptor family member 4 n=1 Tax=Danio rerio TaxID=7955 RepID=E7FEU9_DANRE|nr:progestin and adipoQ receptor family member 4-like [Danio rerio]|eukprot:XP_001920113.1 progestin and adipoQ receptor family member 4-like [Danio rerio]